VSDLSDRDLRMARGCLLQIREASEAQADALLRVLAADLTDEQREILLSED